MSKQLNVRPGARTLQQVKDLAALYHDSVTAVIRIAIDRMYQQEVSQMRDLRLTATDPARQWDWLREAAADLWSHNWQGDAEDIYDGIAEDLVAQWLDHPDTADELPEWWDAQWRERLVNEVQEYADRDLEEAAADA